MKDSVSLLRHKIQDQSLAFQDTTMNTVVTLAAIEHGKGNVHVSKMHINGVKRMVAVRGGLSNVKRTSPLTARMVAWVALLVCSSPQFHTQDDFGKGDGICAIQQWQRYIWTSNVRQDLLDFDSLGLEPLLRDNLNRLRSVLRASLTSDSELSTTDLHDLTCFTLHRLLSLPPFTGLDPVSTHISECLRYGVSLYMFIIHGPTYYSQVEILNTLVLQLKFHLDHILPLVEEHGSLFIWLLSVGVVASLNTNESEWFCRNTTKISIVLQLNCWDDVDTHLKRVLWQETFARPSLQQTWQEITSSNSRLHGFPLDPEGDQATELPQHRGGLTEFGV